MNRHQRSKITPVKRDVSRFTAEFDDVAVERRYWTASQDDLAHWARYAATLYGALSVPLSMVDLAISGFGVRYLCLVAIRALVACVGFGLASLLHAEPATVRRHGLISGACGLLIAGFGVVALTQATVSRLAHLEVALVIIGLLMLVPNRIPFALAVGGSGAALWVAASTIVADATMTEMVTTALVFAVAVSLGWATAVLLGTTRRRAFSEGLAAEIANERLRAELSRRERMEHDLVERANTDPLTKVANRRHFEEQARDEFIRCQRTHQPMALMLIDVDHFKWINDSHGHAVGDEVLRVLSDALAEQVRRIDVVGRLGGEEFAVLMPGADRRRAEEAAQRLRSRVAALRIEVPDGAVRLTVSIGVTECDVWTEQFSVALERADAAMYEAKATGRDRVIMA